jgi:HK97 family phage prohead protease
MRSDTAATGGPSLCPEGAVETKALPFQLSELKAAGDGWEVAGYASTFGGDPDSYGDIVAKGAFLNSLAKRPNVRLLWQHDMGEPIGKVISLTEDDKGLFGRWSIVPTDTGKKAHELLKHDLVDSFSIGFMTGDADYREDGVRVLKEVELVEVSIVTIPANTNATITSFKSVPTKLLLERASEVLREAVREVEARNDRRAAEHRALNDAHVAAFGALVEEAEALHQKLTRPVVLPDVEAQAAEMDLLRMRARLIHARGARPRRTA